MSETSTVVNAAFSVCRPVGCESSRETGNSDSRPRNPAASDHAGVWAVADAALSRILDSAGFVDISAPFTESFRQGLPESPAVGNNDLAAGTLGEILSSVKDELADQAPQALTAQTRVPPETAVRLLT